MSDVLRLSSFGWNPTSILIFAPGYNNMAMDCLCVLIPYILSISLLYWLMELLCIGCKMKYRQSAMWFFFSFSWNEPAHEIMAFFVLRKLILQTRMGSHPVGVDVWCLVGTFVYFHTSCVRTAKALARLHRCAGSPESSLVAYVISVIISWVGSNGFILFDEPLHEKTCLLTYNQLSYQSYQQSWNSDKEATYKYYMSYIMRKPVLPYANNKGADQAAHPCSRISAFVIHRLDSIIPLVSISKISSFQLVCVAEQTGLSLTWSKTQKTAFLVTWLILSHRSLHMS